MRPNRRRVFLAAAGALLGTSWARAQSAGQLRRIAFLNAGTRADVVKVFEEPFLRELAKAGYVEGRNLKIERRYAEGVLERLPALAREVVALKPELILAPPSQSTAALKATGTSIPVVFCFVTEIVPEADLLEYARNAALAVAALPPASVRLTKQLMKRPLAPAIAAQMEEERKVFAERLQSGEAKEAMTAFFEKRKPDFSRF